MPRLSKMAKRSDESESSESEYEDDPAGHIPTDQMIRHICKLKCSWCKTTTDVMPLCLISEHGKGEGICKTCANHAVEPEHTCDILGCRAVAKKHVYHTGQGKSQFDLLVWLCDEHMAPKAAENSVTPTVNIERKRTITGQKKHIAEKKQISFVDFMASQMYSYTKPIKYGGKEACPDKDERFLNEDPGQYMANLFDKAGLQLNVIVREDDEVFVDCDGNPNWALYGAMSLCKDIWNRGVTITVTRSKSRGHYHVILKLPFTMSQLASSFLALYLGSDKEHEIITVGGDWRGQVDSCMLFEVADVEVPSYSVDSKTCTYEDAMKNFDIWLKPLTQLIAN